VVVWVGFMSRKSGLESGGAPVGLNRVFYQTGVRPN
jgi:hypothetical protein